MRHLKPVRVLALALASLVLSPQAHAADASKERAVRSTVVKAPAAVTKTSACETQKILRAVMVADARTSSPAVSPAAGSPFVESSWMVGVCTPFCSVRCRRTSDCHGLGTCKRDCD
jgi:hypothetical protein